MSRIDKTIAAIAVLFILAATVARAEDGDLKEAALEALISVPESRSLPIVRNVLAGDQSDALKRRALFLLSQMESSEASTLLADIARDGPVSLRVEAIRMIAIGGDPQALASLAALYAEGDATIRASVLQAYLIADDSDAILAIANAASNNEEFDAAVHTLGAMGATDKLTALRGRAGSSESLLRAYAVAGDFDSLSALALNTAEPETQKQALHSLGIIDDERVGALLAKLYRESSSAELKEAALHGLLVADDTDTVIGLFQASDDDEDRQRLLRTLVIMDSDAVLDIIDGLLGDGQ